MEKVTLNGSITKEGSSTGDTIFSGQTGRTAETSITSVLKIKEIRLCGIDKIPYDVLRFEKLVKVSPNFFQACFTFGIISQVWLMPLFHQRI